MENCSFEDGDDVEKQMPLLEVSSDPLSSIYFRPLEPKDREQIQDLHEEWFPVSYKDEFYDDLVLQRMVNSGEELYTCAAAYREEQEDESDSANNSPSRSLLEVNEESERHEDSIVACVVGSFVEVSRLSAETSGLLISDPTRHKRMFYIMTLGTVKEFRHHRLATSLVQQIMEIVTNDPECGAVYLHVITFNVAAIRFYEKLGFYRVTEMKDYYRIDDENYNCFVYAKYFHGNRGHKDYYYLLTSLVSSIWKRVSWPFIAQSSEPSKL